MSKFWVDVDTSGAFGDKDRKVVVFSNAHGFQELARMIGSLSRIGDAFYVYSDDPSKLKLKVKLSKRNTCVFGAAYPILYIGNESQQSLSERIGELATSGSYMVIEPDDLSEMECIIAHCPDQFKDSSQIS